MSVSQSTALVQTEIFRQQLDKLPWNFVQTSIVPRVWILPTLVIPLLLLHKYSVERFEIWYETFMVLVVMWPFSCRQHGQRLFVLFCALDFVPFPIVDTLYTACRELVCSMKVGHTRWILWPDVSELLHVYQPVCELYIKGRVHMLHSHSQCCVGFYLYFN